MLKLTWSSSPHWMVVGCCSRARGKRGMKGAVDATAQSEHEMK
jgi:hypothetical protein